MPLAARKADLRGTLRAIRKEYLVPCSPEYNWAKSTRDNYQADAGSDGQYSERFAEIRATLDHVYHGVYTLARQATQDRLVDDVLSHGESQDRPWIVFTAGAMGAGKSRTMSWLSDHDIFPLSQVVTIDADLFKTALPEWDEYVQRDAMSAGYHTRQESGMCCEIAQEAALRSNKHIVRARQNIRQAMLTPSACSLSRPCAIAHLVRCPRVRPPQWVDGSLRDGAWYRRVFETIGRMHPNYQIAIFHIVADEDECLRRAKSRGELTGRYVPESEIRDSIERVPLAVEMLAPLCRFVATLDNSVASEPPRLVRCREPSRAIDLDALSDGSLSWHEIRRRFVFKGLRAYVSMSDIIATAIADGLLQDEDGSAAVHKFSAAADSALVKSCVDDFAAADLSEIKSRAGYLLGMLRQRVRKQKQEAGGQKAEAGEPPMEPPVEPKRKVSTIDDSVPKKKKTSAADDDSAETADLERVRKRPLATKQMKVVELAVVEPKKKTKKEKKRERKAAEVMGQIQQPKDDESLNKRDATEGGLRVFVGHLPQSTTEAELRAYFNCTEIDMLRRADSGRFKGAAFLTFADAGAASKALSLDGAAWNGAAGSTDLSAKRLTVERAGRADDRAGERGDAAAGEGTNGKNNKKRPRPEEAAARPPNLSVFIGNLPAAATDKDVKGALGRAIPTAKFQKVHMLPVMREAPERRAAFVDFIKLEASAAAVKLSGTQLLDRTITVSYSDRQKQEGGGNKKRSDTYLARRKEKREAKLKESGAFQTTSPFAK